MPLLKSDYSYDLPERLIASHPLEQREQSRLMILDRRDQTIHHRQFYRFPDLLEPGSVLVINDSKVIPARLPGTRTSGGAIEVLLVKNLHGKRWSCKIKHSARLKIGEVISLCAGRLTARVVGKQQSGDCEIEIDTPGEALPVLEQVGFAPLPPYIHKVRRQTEDRESDLARYQTVYARTYGSIAAPTAGFHFTDSLLEMIRAKGIAVIAITLHVGLGTFEPIRADDVLNHEMHEETFEISEEAAVAIQTAKKDGRKIVAVGTTTTRTLETAWRNGSLQIGQQKTRLFIHPPYRFQVVDHLLTNFHLPESTLLMLVSAFADKDFILKAYQEAVLEEYRFFSFGDCMFIR